MYVNNIIKIAEQGKPISKWQNHEDNLSRLKYQMIITSKGDLIKQHKQHKVISSDDHIIIIITHYKFSGQRKQVDLFQKCCPD